MIGFQIVYFYREVTHLLFDVVCVRLLWLAFKLFIFTEKSHNYVVATDTHYVVIGFQIVYFYREVTHVDNKVSSTFWLWLAFKLFIFTEKSHIMPYDMMASTSCDWLSNCLFLQRSHTLLPSFHLWSLVVIGFQIVYFYREVTHSAKIVAVSVCCDWLSNCLFLQRSHTWWHAPPPL